MKENDVCPDCGGDTEECDCEDEVLEYDSVELDWNKYPKFENIIPDENSTFFIRFENSEYAEKEFYKLKDKLPDIKLHTKITKKDEECLKIFSNKKEIALISILQNCLMVRLLKNQHVSQLRNYLEEKYMDEVLLFGEIEHLEEELKIKKSKISVSVRTGNIVGDSMGEPNSFWNFYHDGKYIGKALIQFQAPEMNECVPTLVMFEVFPNFRSQGFGGQMVQGIECYMQNHNFQKMRLENTKAVPFWRNLGYDIDIDEGEKILASLDCEDG